MSTGGPGNTGPGCSRDSQRLSSEGTSLQTCLRKPPGHVRCETPQGQTTFAGREPCRGSNAPWGDKLDGNPPLPRPPWQGHSFGGTSKTPMKQSSLESWFMASIPWELSQEKKALWIAGEQAHCSEWGEQPFTTKGRRIVA